MPAAPWRRLEQSPSTKVAGLTLDVPGPSWKCVAIAQHRSFKGISYRHQDGSNVKTNDGHTTAPRLLLNFESARLQKWTAEPSGPIRPSLNPITT